MDIEAVTTEEGWQALEPGWDSLVERSASATVFLTAEWLRPWWRHFRRPDETLWILAAREGDSLVGLAPLCRGRVRAAGRLGSLRRVGFIGDHSGDSEYLDFLAAPGREGDVTRAFLDHIAANAADWDLLEFLLLPKASPSYEAVRRFCAERGYLADEREWACLSIPLPGDWESYLKTLQPRFRSKLRSLERRLPAGREAAYESCADAADLPSRLESLFDLHQRRWRAAGKPGAFADAARCGFYREMGEAFLRRGWLRFCSLQIEGRWAAHEFSFEHLGRVSFLQQAFDTGCAESNVGTALKGHVIRESIERGAREYDFLGGGAEYKGRWGAQERPCVSLVAARPGVRTRLHLWLPRFGARVRDGGRALTPAPLLRLKRRVQEQRRRRRFPPSEASEGEGRGQ